jgi:hypothetical protein
VCFSIFLLRNFPFNFSKSLYFARVTALNIKRGVQTTLSYYMISTTLFLNSGASPHVREHQTTGGAKAAENDHVGRLACCVYCVELSTKTLIRNIRKTKKTRRTQTMRHHQVPLFTLLLCAGSNSGGDTGICCER